MWHWRRPSPSMCMNMLIKSAVKGNGSGYVAVYVSAFDEIVTILSQAADDPVFSSVRWYGNDLTNVAVSQNKTAAEFAFSVHFLSPVIGGMCGPKYEQIKKAIFNATQKVENREKFK